MSMCPKDKIQQIIDCIDLFLDGKGLKSISAVAAAEILDKAGILKDSHSRPGKPLRDILRKIKFHMLNKIIKDGLFHILQVK